MKKTIFLTTLLCGLSLLMEAQSYYNFVQRQTSYTQLTTGTKVNPLPGNPQFYQPILAKPIRAFGTTTSTTITIGSGGFLISTSAQYSFAFDPFLAKMVVQSGDVYMLWDTVGAEKHLLVEWRDFQLEGHPASDFVNFKVDFNLSNEVIEYHYGPSQITDTVGFHNGNTGPQAIVALLTPDFTRSFFFNALEGDPSNPTHHRTPVAAFLNAVPASGTVFRFEPEDISIDEFESGLKAYPNPVVDFLNFEDLEEGVLLIYDLRGSLLPPVTVTGGRADLSDLPPGQYLIRVSGDDNLLLRSYKIIKQ